MTEKLTFGQELAAAINAEFEDDDPTTEEEGNVYTFVADGALSVPTPDGVSIVLERGSVLEVTPDLVEAARDRTGRSWLEYIDADLRFTRGEPTADLRAEIAAAAEETAKAAYLDELKEARRYGKMTPGPSAETLDRVAEHVQWAASVRSSKEI